MISDIKHDIGYLRKGNARVFPSPHGARLLLLSFLMLVLGLAPGCIPVPGRVPPFVQALNMILP